MVIRDKVQSPDIKLNPAKETLEKLPKKDRFAYAVIVGLLLFVLAVLTFSPHKGDLDANFWIVVLVIVCVTTITIYKASQDKQSEDEGKAMAERKHV